jgi:hypothetical protein
MRGFGPDNDMDYRAFAYGEEPPTCEDCDAIGVVWDARTRSWRCNDCHAEHQQRMEDGPSEPSYSGGASERIASGYDALAQRRRG